MIKKLLRQYQWQRNIRRSGMFDVKHYLFSYPDVRFSDIDPVKHYVKYGVGEGRNPSKTFDTNYYLEHNQDVRESGVNPFYHWLKYGQSEGRRAKDIVIMPLQNSDEEQNDIFHKEEPYESWKRINLKANQYNDFTLNAQASKLYIERFKSLIESKEVISFDIFDTLIERNFLHPHAIFEYVEKIAKQEEQISFDFALLRIEAELEARKECKAQEITLDEIYETLMYHSTIPKKLCDYLKAKELELEKKSLQVKSLGKELFDIAKASNKELLLISDMYLPKAFVMELLSDLGFEIESQDFYLSGEEKLTKHHGGLYTKIAKEREIDSSQWLHVGDNLHSDIHMPTTMGIDTFYLRNASKGLQQQYAQVDIETSSLSLEASSIYGTLAHRLYSANEAPSLSFYSGDPYRIGYETLGVLFVGFLNFLMRLLQTKEYSKIFFVSRDGCYLQIIYDTLRKINPKLPPSHYLLSSRAMMYSSSLVDKESISYVANKDYFPTTLKHLLEVRFNFDEEMFERSKAQLKKFGFVSFEDEVKQDNNHQNYVDFVLSQKSSIIANNAHHQENFIEYIQELGVDESSLIVDIGYAGSLQKTLLTLTKQKIDALYFVTNSKVKELSSDGIKHHAYIPYDHPLSEKFFHYVQLFELFFSTTHASVTALQKDQNRWLPSLDSNGFSARSNQVLASLHQGGVEFVEDYLHHHYGLFTQSKFTPEIATQNIFAFFEKPSSQDAKLFNEIIFEDDFGANRYALITNDFDKLQLDDEKLLREGIWAQASKQLAIAKEYVDISKVEPSSKFCDHLNEVLEVMPYYERADFQQVDTLSIQKSATTFLKLFIRVDAKDARRMIESLSYQHYPYFRALFVFDEEITDELREYIVASENVDYTLSLLDKKLFEREEWIVLIDRALLFEPNFLMHIAYSIEQESADIIYLDEDDYGEGELINPQFKPDFSPELMLSQPYYVGGAIACKVESLHTLSQEFPIENIVFDAMIREEKIHHIPKILFHNLDEQSRRDYKPLIENYLNTIGLPYEAVIEQEFSKSASKPVYSLQFANSGPDIAIIIPTKNMFDVLKVALDSLEMTSYQNYTVYIIDNDSDEENILEYFATTRHKVLKISSPNGVFSYSYVNNEAAKMVDEKYILFLNNDIKVITPEWLSQMAGLIQIDGVGSVGARLYYGNDKLQHVGITNRVAPYGLPAPSFKLIDGDASGYLDYAQSIKNFSAMTAACMLTTKKIFMQMGGFDDEDFSVAYNDCDYGFKLTQAGYRTVVAPNAQLYHYEGVTRGIGVGNDKPSEEAAFVRKYKNWQDPYYNPNLTTMGTDFAIASTIVRKMPDHKFRVLMVSHNYEYEGASLILFEIAKALKESYAIEPVVLSMEDGPLREAYEAQGIEAHYFEEFSLYFAPTLEVYNEHLWKIEKRIHSLGVNVLFANTVLCYWAIEVANRLKIASLWLIHESEPPFEHLREHGRFIEERGKAAMTYAYKSIFVAQSTRELFEPYNFKNNFEVIYNGFDTSRVSIAMDAQMRSDMRKSLGIEDKFVFICPGIVSPRKAQMDAIRAYEKLSKSIKKEVVVLIVGDRASEYSTQLHEYHKKSEKVVQKNIHIIAETKEIGNYYNAADAFLFTSHLESFPKVIQEAMYLRLPIVSTNTFGIKEQVFHNSSALLCDVGDINALANNMQTLYEDKALREKLIDNATSALDKLPTYEEMVKAYHELLQEAYLLSKRGL